MAYQKQYTKNEAQFMLQVYEGAQAYRGAVGGTIQRHGAPAHASLHGGGDFLAQRARVTTPGSPRTTGTFQTADQQAAALAEALNHGNGQLKLAELDANPGQREIKFNAPLTPGRYQMSSQHDDSDLGGAAGHLGRNNAGRAAATTTRTIANATGIFVFAMRAPGGQLQIQTCYPT